MRAIVEAISFGSGPELWSCRATQVVESSNWVGLAQTDSDMLARLSQCGVGGGKGIKEVKIGIDLWQCPRGKEVKPMRAQEQPAGKTITNGMNKRTETEM